MLSEKFLSKVFFLNFYYYTVFQPVMPMNSGGVIDQGLPGIGQYKASMPVKVTNMQLVSGMQSDRGWTGALLNLADDQNTAGGYRVCEFQGPLPPF